MDAKRPKVLITGDLSGLSARLGELPGAAAQFEFVSFYGPNSPEQPASLGRAATSVLEGQVEAAAPDLLVLDYQAAGERAFDEIALIHATEPGLLIIVVNSEFSRALCSRVLGAGASAVVFQGFGASAVLGALVRVAAGEIAVMSPEVAPAAAGS